MTELNYDLFRRLAFPKHLGKDMIHSHAKLLFINFKRLGMMPGLFSESIALPQLSATVTSLKKSCNKIGSMLEQIK